MYWFKTYSEDYGEALYGPYDRKADAQRAIRRIQANAEGLDDGVERFYTSPYRDVKADC